MMNRTVNCVLGGFKDLVTFYDSFYFHPLNSLCESNAFGVDVSKALGVEICKGVLGREVGVPNRVRLIYDARELAKFVLNNNKAGRESHASTLLYRPVRFGETPPIEADNVDTDGRGLGAIPAIIDRIVVEPEFESLDETLEYVPKWVESFRLKPVIVFSGNKSLHLHFLIKPVPLNYEDGWFEALAKAFVNWLAKPLKPSTKRKFLKSIDWNVMRPKSMHRMPYSLNPETGKCSSIAVVEDGSVRFVEDISEALRIVKSIGRLDIKWLVESVTAELAWSKIDSELSRQVVHKTQGRGCRNEFIEKLLNVSGLEDGRQRSLFYFIIPYLVQCNCKRRGLSEEECVSQVGVVVEDWLKRQGIEGRALKEYMRWARGEIRNVFRKGIKPWGRDKVLDDNPDLKDTYRRHGLPVDRGFSSQ